MTTAPSRKKGALYNLACGGYKSYGAKECGNHFIDYGLLYNTVLQEIRFWLSLSNEDRNSIVEELESKEASAENENGVAEALERLEQRIQEVTLLIKKAYEEFSFGKMPESIYKNLSTEYQAEYESLEKSIVETKKLLQPEVQQVDLYNNFFALLDEITDVEVLSESLLKKLIERIEVEQGYYEKDATGKKVKHQRIKIYYRFIGCVEETS